MWPLQMAEAENKWVTGVIVPILVKVAAKTVVVSGFCAHVGGDPHVDPD